MRTSLSYLAFASLLFFTKAHSTKIELLDFPEDVLHPIAKHLSSGDLTALRQVSLHTKRIADKELEELMHALTVDHGNGYEDHRLGQRLSKRQFQILLNLADTKGAIPLTVGSPLNAMMTGDFNLVQLDDWLTHVQYARPLYRAIFGHELPENSLHQALQHLMALSESWIYVAKNDCGGLGRFLNVHGESFIARIQKLTSCPHFVNLLHGELNHQKLKERPHTLVLSDTEFVKPAVQELLKKLLSDQSEHHVYLCVGWGPLVKGSMLTLLDDDLPANLSHLTLNNPAGNVRRIIAKFLSQTTLRSLRICFPNLDYADNQCLSNNIMLTSLSICFPKLTRVKNHFVSGNPVLQNAVLHFPRLKETGLNFFRNNLRLSSVELGKIRDYLSSLGLEWQEDGSVKRDVDSSAAELLTYSTAR